MRMLSRDSTGWRVTGDRRRRTTIISDGREATTSRDAGGRGDGQRGAGGSRGAVREARGGVERARVSRGRRERTARVRTRGGALLLADAGDRGDTRRRRATRRNPADWLTPIGALRREARRRERREARDGRHLCERTRLCRVSVAAAVLPIGDDVARTDVPRTICPGTDPCGPLDLRAGDLRTAVRFRYPDESPFTETRYGHRDWVRLSGRSAVSTKIVVFSSFSFSSSSNRRPMRARFPLCGSRAARTRATGDGSDRDKRRGSPERASPRVHHAEERAGSVSPPPLPVLHAALAAAAAHRRPISRFSRRTIPTPAADRGDDSSRTNAKLARFTSFAPRRSDDVHDGHFRTSEPPPTRRLFRRRRVRHPRGHHRGRGRG
jgi:hypothetical protein